MRSDSGPRLVDRSAFTQKKCENSKREEEELHLLTFSALSISANVLPSYSNIGSHPRESRLNQPRPHHLQLRLRPARHDSGHHPYPPNHSTRKMGAKGWVLPNFPSPLAGTILPSVLPWKIKGSHPGPAEKAKVQTASADLSA